VAATDCSASAAAAQDSSSLSSPGDQIRGGTAVLNLWLASAGAPGPDARRADGIRAALFERLSPLPPRRCSVG
jgi:hypothetical protein